MDDNDIQACVKCSHNKSKMCKCCKDGSEFDKLYDADAQCKHNIISAKGGGVKCTKCNGWFCY